MASTAASNLNGAWFGELASALQGTWQAAAATATATASASEKPGRGVSDSNKAARGAAAAGRDKEVDVARCCGAMSDTTMYLLLDRFTPN